VALGSLADPPQVRTVRNDRDQVLLACADRLAEFHQPLLFGGLEKDPFSRDTLAKHFSVYVDLFGCFLFLSPKTFVMAELRDPMNEDMQGRERYTVLPPRLLEALRAYWRIYRPPIYLFPGQTLFGHLSPDSSSPPNR